MTLVYAHRGGAALAPENTLVAFDNGLACGAEGIELDVHLSRDGEVVVHHDETLERTTNSRGAVRQRTVDELAQMDAAFHYSDADGLFTFRGRGIGVPTLREVLRRYPSAPLLIELKVGGGALATRVLDEVRTAGARDRVSIGSFHSDAVHVVRASDPGIPTGATRAEIRLALYRSWARWPVRHARYREYQVPARSGLTRIVTPRFVDDAHRAGFAVKVWTVNDERLMRDLVAWGVDALITDRPDLARRVVDST